VDYSNNIEKADEVYWASLDIGEGSAIWRICAVVYSPFVLANLKEARGPRLENSNGFPEAFPGRDAAGSDHNPARQSDWQTIA
jgi:hypothetical protein